MPQVDETAESLSGLRDALRALPLNTLLHALLLFAVGVILIRVVLNLLGRLLRRTRLDASLHRFIHTVVRVILWICLTLIVAEYLGIDVTSLVALLSVVSLAISLSVQSALSNVAGGMMVIGAKPFKRGDYVAVDDMEGTVDEIGVVYTTLHTIDNRSVLIPNSRVSNATIQNFSALGKRRLELEVSASYASDPERVMEALRTAVERCNPLPKEETRVEFHSFDESSICYHVHFWVPASRFVQTRFDLRRSIWTAFRAAGVEMTYPHLNVHLQQASEKPDVLKRD
ncbi:MAG: mechanosensitive ion channel family protein [Oscillospiraceae bacterium]|nr:mechanosensitive ion channel family protein [Oscillospiraceae bacterium]